jgi:hypothetical protein
MPFDQAVHTIEEAPGTVNALFAPLQIFSGGAANSVYKRPVSAPYLSGHFVCAYHVAFGLGHRRAALEHHALCEQPRNGLIVPNSSRSRITLHQKRE